MYIVVIMSLKINIWTLKFLFKYENWYFNYETIILILKSILKFETWYLNLNFFISIFWKNIWISKFRF
jgi:hypothetical protein